MKTISVYMLNCCMLNQVLILVLLDLPGLLFFSTYTLLVLFWAEIYHQASALFSGTVSLMLVLVVLSEGQDISFTNLLR